MESYIEKILNGKDPAKKGKSFWNDLAVHWDLSEDDMRKYAEFFNWRKLSDHQKNISETFIREYADMVHWDRISQRIQMTEEFIDEFKDKVNWDYIWSYQRHISVNFIEGHLACCERVDWSRINMYHKLTTEFLMKHVDEIGVGAILEYQRPKKELIYFLEEHIKTLSKDKQWVEEKFLSYKLEKVPVSEEQILYYIKLREKHNWGGKGWWIVTEHQKLSEEFIEKNYKSIKSDFKSLDPIWKTQALSEKFLKKHEKDVHWGDVFRNKKIKKTAWIEKKIDEFYENLRKRNGYKFSERG